MIPVTPGQGWRLSVQHTTGYRYGKEVAASYNEARLIPRTTPCQLPLGTRVHHLAGRSPDPLRRLLG